jgi:carbon-monoxide dehydrogenase medium subunit
MVAQNFEYSAPRTMDEALSLLAGGAKPLAGGMSLIPMMKLRLATPEHLVDLARIKDLNYIREEGGHLHIGATVTHYSIESSALVRSTCPLLAETAGWIGDNQVRNQGTIGGSMAHADPSSDYPAALQALEARIVIKGAKGERSVTAKEFFLDAFTTALDAGELIREVIVPVETAGTGVSYQKLPHPASGFAMVGVAVRVRKTGGKISFARVGVTGLSNYSFSSAGAQDALENSAGAAADVQRAASLVAIGIDANSDLQASADYRRHLAGVYAARAINAALTRIA